MGVNYAGEKLGLTTQKAVLPQGGSTPGQEMTAPDLSREPEDKAMEESLFEKGSKLLDGKNIAKTEDLDGITEGDGADIAKTDLVPVSEGANDVSEVVKSVMPAVVSVSNSYTAQMQFFGQVYSQEATSAGSGIIVGMSDSELLLVTNYHVVQDADELTVIFDNDDSVAAQVKGTDPDRDLAVIVVQLGDINDETLDEIAIANLGDSDVLEVGEPVIAIGNALGYGQSVTTGVVSALNRPIAATTSDYSTGDSEVSTFIQTDAAINPGNSGGALLNMKGEVVGINSNKIGGSTVEGMGYAIPISDAKPIIQRLMNEETKLKVSDESRGYLGITGVSVEKEYSQVYGMPVGVYISSVSEGSAADKAGLVRGDVITKINGQKVESMEDLKEEMQYYAAGTKVTLTIMQGSPNGYNARDVQVVLGSVDEVKY